MELLTEGLGEELKRLRDAIRTATAPDIAFSSQRVSCRGDAWGSNKTTQGELAILIAQAAQLGFLASTRARSTSERKEIMMGMTISGQTLGMLRRQPSAFQKKWIDALIEMMAQTCITSLELERLLRVDDLAKTLSLGSGIDVGLGVEHGLIALEIYRVGGESAPSGDTARTLGRMLLAMAAKSSQEKELVDEDSLPENYLRKVWRENGILWEVNFPPRSVVNQLIARAKEEAQSCEAASPAILEAPGPAPAKIEVSRPEPARPEPVRSAVQRPRG